MIYAETLGEIKELAEQFDESGFKIYTSRALVEVDEDVKILSRDLQAKLVMSEALESVRTRFLEVVELSDSLDEQARERLFKREEEELVDYMSAFIGRSLTEWLERGLSDPVLIGSLGGTAQLTSVEASPKYRHNNRILIFLYQRAL